MTREEFDTRTAERRTRPEMTEAEAEAFVAGLAPLPFEEQLDEIMVETRAYHQHVALKAILVWAADNSSKMAGSDYFRR